MRCRSSHLIRSALSHRSGPLALSLRRTLCLNLPGCANSRLREVPVRILEHLLSPLHGRARLNLNHRDALHIGEWTRVTPNPSTAVRQAVIMLSGAGGRARREGLHAALR